MPDGVRLDWSRDYTEDTDDQLVERLASAWVTLEFERHWCEDHPLENSVSRLRTECDKRANLGRPGLEAKAFLRAREDYRTEKARKMLPIQRKMKTGETL